MKTSAETCIVATATRRKKIRLHHFDHILVLWYTLAMRLSAEMITVKVASHGVILCFTTSESISMLAFTMDNCAGIFTVV